MKDGVDRGMHAQNVLDEAAGLVNILVYQPRDIRALLGQYLKNRSVNLVVFQVLQQIRQAPFSDPICCCCCDRRLQTGRFSIVAVTAAQDDPSLGMAAGICCVCATDSATAERKAIIALRKLRPDENLVPVSHRQARQA